MLRKAEEGVSSSFINTYLQIVYLEIPGVLLSLFLFLSDVVYLEKPRRVLLLLLLIPIFR